MADPLKILAPFLKNIDSDVEPRSGPPPTNVQGLLHRFVDGKCTGDEIEKACQALDQNPEWVSWVAQQAKDRQ